ncbi:hypothetical protein AVEN_61396-1 [Araneus ventricosus]|uniref:Uncharacterized protein n=1 Tax=Araneus ventricosus TaxID=182803 RepID=A0A4Y2QFJ6_ARAVE|nr:hypothetical protein AVEN_61396-1 [Araneus ventricosus]
MGPVKKPPFSGQSTQNFDAFFIIKRSTETDENFGNVSPFLVEKAITGSVGVVTSTKSSKIQSLNDNQIKHVTASTFLKSPSKVLLSAPTVTQHKSSKNKTDQNETYNANAVNLPSDSSRGNSSDSESDISVTSAPEASNPQKNKARSKSEKLYKLKQAKRGLSQKDLPAKLKKSAHKNSVALGLADRGIVHKDLPSIFVCVPQVPDLQLHPSEEDEDLQMNCDVSATSPRVPSSQTPTLS